MFMRLATVLGANGAQAIAQLHPAELVELMERGWNLRMNQPAAQLGLPDRRSDVPGLFVPEPPIVAAPGVTGAVSSTFASLLQHLGNQRYGIRWDHLIYAYMVENSRIYEIFRRVVHEFLHGEKLGVPAKETQLWLRSTEEVFYRDPPPFSITGVSSHLRPDLRATRRNAYQRMFGMDLNHGNDDNSPYPYPRADAANKEFVTTFEELLREVWVGHIHRATTTANPTDTAKIADLASKLYEMLTTRRLSGNLSREEFYFVAMMSWFHVSVSDSELSIIRDLRAQGASAEQRLFGIAQRVGLPAHGLSRSYFEIAQPMSAVLSIIETGAMNSPTAARGFFDPAVNAALSALMNTIVMHWSLITGRDVKAGKVATAA